MKRLLVFLTVFFLLSGMVCHGAMFPDTEGHWAAEYIEFLAREGIISGMGDGTFAPNSSCTRAQAARIIYGLIKLEGDK